jgi:polyisoprenoid-binding protein YceI
VALGLVPAGLAQAPAYRVDTELSRVYVRVDTATRLGHPHGVEGRLAPCRLSLAGAGQLAFDMASFRADTAEARRRAGLAPGCPAPDARKATEAMLGASVLDAAHHPRAAFDVSAVAPLDGQAPGRPGRYRLAGRFTLRGVTRPLEFVAVAEAGAGAGSLRLRGEFTLSQAEYGIEPYSALGGLARVADRLHVWGDLTLTPAP